MKRFIVLAALLCGPILSVAKEEMTLRLFTVAPSLNEVLYDFEHPMTPEEREKGEGGFITCRSWRPIRDTGITKKFFQSEGLPFPDDAYIKLNNQNTIIRHYNTEENHKVLGQLIRPYTPFNLVADATFIDFPLAVIENAARKNGIPALTSKDILKLWQDGKGTVLHMQKTQTRSGVNSQIQAVTEFIYPTEFDDPSTNSTSSEASPTQLLQPGAFDTRESGAIFNFTPTVADDRRTIDIVLVSEITTFMGLDKITVEAKAKGDQQLELTIPQPRFHCRKISTNIMMKDGSTHVLGGMLNPTEDAMTYLFITTTLIDGNGTPLSEYAGDPLVAP